MSVIGAIEAYERGELTPEELYDITMDEVGEYAEEQYYMDNPWGDEYDEE